MSESDSDLFTTSFKAMGSPCEIRLIAESLARAESVSELAIKEIQRLEQKYSRFRDDSLLTDINSRAGSGIPTPIDLETYTLLKYSDQCYRHSDGLFDITSGVLSRVWNLKSKDLPSKAAIEAVLSLVGWSSVDFDEATVELVKPGMQLDFGGVVKEYAADAAANLCKREGITGGFVNLGGDITIIGPNKGDSPWQVGVATPWKREVPIANIPLKEGAIATSGDYERCKIVDGERYSHLLNPKTGWPVKSFASVSIHSTLCLTAGSLATIVMLKGIEEGLEWLQDVQVPFLAVTHEGKIYKNEF